MKLEKGHCIEGEPAGCYYIIICFGMDDGPNYAENPWVGAYAMLPNPADYVVTREDYWNVPIPPNKQPYIQRGRLAIHGSLRIFATLDRAQQEAKQIKNGTHPFIKAMEKFYPGACNEIEWVEVAQKCGAYIE